MCQGLTCSRTGRHRGRRWVPWSPRGHSHSPHSPCPCNIGLNISHSLHSPYPCSIGLNISHSLRPFKIGLHIIHSLHSPYPCNIGLNIIHSLHNRYPCNIGLKDQSRSSQPLPLQHRDKHQSQSSQPLPLQHRVKRSVTILTALTPSTYIELKLTKNNCFRLQTFYPTSNAKNAFFSNAILSTVKYAARFQEYFLELG